MAYALNTESITQAWLNGVELLLAQPGHTAFNIILDIAAPLEVSDEEQAIIANINRFLVTHGKYPLQTVANTVFPESLYNRHGAEGVFEIYPESVYPVIKKANRWGTYIHRMVRREDRKGKVINPLKRVIEALKTESRGRNPKRARYELGMTDPFADISIADPTLSFANQAIGGPCLSHLSFKLDAISQQVRLIAFYRSHYYIERAFGNLIGLARLLSFVAEETGLEAGPLTCISSYAQIDSGPHWRCSEVRTLISECKAMLPKVKASARAGCGAGT